MKVFMKFDTFNKQELWNKLLSNDSYINDNNRSTFERISTAYEWTSKRNSYLDIGSGQGYLEKFAFAKNRSLMSKWVSMDISNKGLENIRNNFNVKVVLSNIVNAPFRDNQFDCIYCMEVLEHINKITVIEAYRVITKILTNGGLLVLSVPVYEPCSLKNHPVGHCRKYTPKIIESEIQANSFKILKSKAIFSFVTANALKNNITNIIKIRRPNVMVYLCQKS
jgi:SAM-dependent methyltransferase